MTGPTRREFLAAVGGGVLTAPAIAATDLLAAVAQTEPTQRAKAAIIPPHTPQIVEGVHAYTDRMSVAAGEKICFHVSSSFPYELEVCRLGPNPDGPDNDEVLHSFGSSPPSVQPIHPGSYVIVDKSLDADEALSGLSIEIWIRRWRTVGRQAIVTQFDEPDHCGFGLFVNEDGSLSFYAGDGGRFDKKNLLTTPPGQLVMIVNPEGLKIRADNTPSSVASNQWHHVVARLGEGSKQIWVDGKLVAEEKTSLSFRPGAAPLRIGGAGRQGRTSELLDADIAMPAIYAKALSPTEIEARFKTEGLEIPTDPALHACWPLSEERGDTVADTSPHGRSGRIVNHGTWMIGGPSHHADVPRFGDYKPENDPRRGHGLRLMSDDLYDCYWDLSHEYRIPETARSGIYVGRIRFQIDGESRLYHVVFIVRRATSRPQAPIAFLCATSSWKAYSATPFSPTWEGIKKSVPNNGFANSEGEPPAGCFYRVHRAGPGTYQLGFRIPWPVVGPYTLMGAEQADYSHLCRQDRFTQIWLEANNYEYDTLSDTDLHLDPHALDGYKVLLVVGHSEYWSAEAVEKVDLFLSQGGNVVCLSGNTAIWRTTFNEDGSIIECRKEGDLGGGQVTRGRRGEMWHSHDGQRGGFSRECGCPAWKVFGLEAFSLVNAGGNGVGPYKVRNPDHFLFKEPRDLKLKEGDDLAGIVGRLPQPIGHEGDVRLSTMAKYSVLPLPDGATGFPTDDPQGIALLAEGVVDTAKIGFANWDYFGRDLPRRSANVAAEMIYWERPEGGKVFNSGSINSGATLSIHEKWSGLLQNVIDHFGGGTA